MSGYKTFFIEDERETNSQVSINGRVVISLLGCGILQGGGDVQQDRGTVRAQNNLGGCPENYPSH